MRTEAKRRQEKAKSLVMQQQHGIGSLRRRINQVLRAFDFDGGVHGKEDFERISFSQAYDDYASMTPAAVKEAGKRTLIRQMYNPLEALVIPAAELEMPQSRTAQNTARDRDPLAAGGSPQRRAPGQ